MAQLIDEHLVLQLAKSKNLYPNDDDINTLMKDSMQADPDLQKRWLMSGQTEDELKYQFVYQAAKFKLQTEGINVAQQEVEDFYKKNPPTLPKSIKLAVIAVANEADEKTVDADLAAGKSFGEVAKQRSIDRSQADSGEIGTLPETAELLVAVARLRLVCRAAGITEVSAASAATLRLSPLSRPDQKEADARQGCGQEQRREADDGFSREGHDRHQTERAGHHVSANGGSLQRLNWGGSHGPPTQN